MQLAALCYREGEGEPEVLLVTSRNTRRLIIPKGWPMARHSARKTAKKEAFEEAGLVASGINTATNLVEIVEIPGHPWFIGVQYHPEYKSTVANPHPLFVGFIKAVQTHKKQQTNTSMA